MTSDRDRRRAIDTTNTRLQMAIGWVDRVLPFRRLRPLERIPSVKLKLSLVIGAAIAVTVATLTVSNWLHVPVVWGIALAIGVDIVLVQILARGLTAPLTEMMRAADDLAAGDFHQRVTATAADEVGELARSFNAMAARIADLEQQRRDLIANVSHELRTPIAALHGNLENLLDGVVEDREATLQSMLRQAERLGRLVAQLLDLSRLQAGAAPMRPVGMDLVGVVADVLAEARLWEPEPKIVVEAPQHLLVRGDPERLYQVVANLVDNAFRYNPVDEPITITLATVEHGTTIAVEDRGPGIPIGELDRVFERFHRSDSARAVAASGSGLGLAISKWIVERHGGTITAANVSPRGCRMTVFLPSTPAADDDDLET
jgi:signal transduction histidine kinase